MSEIALPYECVAEIQYKWLEHNYRRYALKLSEQGLTRNKCHQMSFDEITNLLKCLQLQTDAADLVKQLSPEDHATSQNSGRIFLSSYMILCDSDASSLSSESHLSESLKRAAEALVSAVELVQVSSGIRLVSSIDALSTSWKEYLKAFKLWKVASREQLRREITDQRKAALDLRNELKAHNAIYQEWKDYAESYAAELQLLLKSIDGQKNENCFPGEFKFKVDRMQEDQAVDTAFFFVLPRSESQ